jgi:uncharacterized protein YcaQ
MTLDDLRRLAVAQTLFAPTTLDRAIEELMFVQADPIRAPARAQDLTLRHRVEGYRAGDLDRAYEALGVEEDFFVNYGFVTRDLQALMHPRPDVTVPSGTGERWPPARRRRAKMVLDFVRERGQVHPREVEAGLGHGKVTNAWGGTSNATTQILDGLHYVGRLRVARREKGVRVYAIRQHGPGPADAAERRAHLDALVDAVVKIYAPLPAPSLSFFVRRLRFAVPQWRGEITGALARARDRLASTTAGGVTWYWSAGQDPKSLPVSDTVRLLSPFDPVVQDRARFELLWGWVYRFEAYTPVRKRKLGYYALPLLWRDKVIGWGNLAIEEGSLAHEIGYVAGRAPRDRAFARELAGELDRVRSFLDLTADCPGSASP